MLTELTKFSRPYAPDQEVPLAGYVATMATYTGVLALILFGVTRRARWQPSTADLVLLGVGTHKLSRILTKDAVTSPLRAPFTERREAEGAGEVHDVPRQGSELQRSLGVLLTCPYCAGPWLATGLSALLAWRPVPTRFVLRTLTAVTLSDFLHLGYSRLNESRKTLVAERRLRQQG